MKRLLIADMSAVFSQMWHATADQEISQARRRTVDALRKHEEPEQRRVIAIDSDTSWRKEAWPQYKATRERRPETYYEEHDRTVEELRRERWEVLGARGFEGDDIIATVIAQDRGDSQVTIVGSDKDLYQLLGGNVVIANNLTGATFRETDLMDKALVRPEQIPAYLALVGDKADNIPGVKGVGAKKAAELLDKYGTLGAIIDASVDASDDWPIGDACRQAIAAAVDAPQGETLEDFVRLTTLRRDAPLEGWESKVRDETAEQAERDYVDHLESNLPRKQPVGNSEVREVPVKELATTAEKLATAHATVMASLDEGTRRAEVANGYTSFSVPCDQIAGALAMAQLEIASAIKEKTAEVRHKDGGGKHSYTYATLAAVQEAAKPLAKYGIGYVQLPGGKSIETILMHKSGQWIRCRTPIEYRGGGPQLYGSAVTYARRYALTAIAGIPVEDDDGESAQAEYGSTKR
jgi:5'-3' exonuclease